MFTKAQFFIGAAVSAVIAYGAGYSKAREKCLEAIINVTAKTNENSNEEKEDE